MIINKGAIERRANSYGDVVGHDIDIVWGIKPKTNGETIFLPDEEMYPFDNPSMVQAAFDHEFAHILFKSPISKMHEWMDMWGDGQKHDINDPYGVMRDVADNVIQTLEDHRIESLYGDLFYGARKRFEDEFRERLNGNISTPASAFHGVRCGRYSEVRDEFPEYADFFYEVLEKVKGSGPEMTFYLAEAVMNKILPWYEQYLNFTEESDEISETEENIRYMREEKKELERELKRKEEEKKRLEQEKNEALAEDDWQEADDFDDQIDDIEEEKDEIIVEIEQTEKEIEEKEKERREMLEEQEEQEERREEIMEAEESLEWEDEYERDDWEPPSEVFDTDEDEEESDEEGEDKELDSDESDGGEEDGETDEEGGSQDEVDEDIAEQIRKGKIPDIEVGDEVSQMIEEIEDNMKFEPVEKEEKYDRGIRASDVDIREPHARAEYGDSHEGVVNQITTEFERIWGAKFSVLSSSGTDVSIDAVIDSEATGGVNLDIFKEEMVDTGFEVLVLLDLSHSMKGDKVNMCRNVGLTLYDAFDELPSDVRYDIAFAGYGGHKYDHGRVGIFEAEEKSELKRIKTHSSYPGTPTWAALEYAREKMSTSSNGVKFVVVITDGVPSGYDEDGNPVSTGRCLRWTKQAVSSCRSNGISVFTIGISVPLTERKMKEFYGSYTNVADPNNAGQVLLDYVRSSIITHIEES